MLRERAPGVKILWLWAVGTAAVLVTNVVRTRLSDMEKLMKAEEQAAHVDNSLLIDDSPHPDEIVPEEKS